MRRLRKVSIAALAFALTFASTARAEDEDDRKAAARSFVEGRKAYNEGDFRHAAVAFEAAYKRAPRLPALWNAARAWDKGGDPVRAANLYASYLRKAPPDAPDRNSATSALQKLEAKLARVEIHADGFTDLKVDGTLIDLDDQTAASIALYVTPGTHLVNGTRDGKDAQKTFSSDGGHSTSVLLVAQKDDATPPPPPPPPPPKEKPDEPPHSGWSPIVVLVGGGLTAVAGGVLIWSGVNTESQKSAFTSSPTAANLDSGKSAETRTNVLVGVTAGLGVLTGVVAIFLVDWKGSAHADTSAFRVRVGPGQASIEGTF